MNFNEYMKYMNEQEGSDKEQSCNCACSQDASSSQQSERAHTEEPRCFDTPVKPDGRRYVSFGACIACVLAAALISGAVGAFAVSLFSSKQNTASKINAKAGSNVNIIKSSSSTIETSLASITKECINSIVGIETDVGTGSGVIISDDGYIITNYHVIDGARTITAFVYDGTSYAASIRGVDERTDIAVLKIDAAKLSPITFGISADVNIGESVIAIGNPLGTLRSSVSSGIISGIDREMTVGNVTMTLLQTDASINPGNSGGGLFNMKGELIGVVNAKAKSIDIEGLGFAVPSDTVLAVSTELIENGFVQDRPYLALTMQDATIAGVDKEDMFNMLFGSLYRQCAQVTDVEKGGKAEKAGVLKGDYIVMVDKKEVSCVNDINAVLLNHSIGDKLVLTIQRDSNEFNITVELEERSAK